MPVRTIGRCQIVAIIDRVRTYILEWSLKLEHEGILGGGLTFSQEEREKAASSPQIHIENFQGIFGNVNGSNVNQQLSMEVRVGDLNGLKDFLLKNAVTKEDIAELEAAIETDDKLIEKGKLGPKVSNWMGKMVTKAASGLWNISISTASSLISRALMQFYGMTPPTSGGAV